MKNIFCRGFMFLAFTLVAATTSFGQDKSLKIGESLPDSVWSTPLQVVNHPQKTITLSQDKDKLILLDFWATWCSACLLNFPKMHALQKQFGDQIKILAVTDQSRVVLEKFFSTTNGKRYDKTVSVADDKMLHQLFPHRGIPYIVWIKDGKVITTTDADQVTEKTIQELLTSQPSSLQTVIQMSKDRPLFLSEDFDRQKNVQMLHYSFFSRGHIPAIGSGGTLRKSTNEKIYGCQFTNLPLYDIYFSIGYQLFKSLAIHESFSEKRMIVEVSDPKNITGIVRADGTLHPEEVYSYEMTVPVTKSDSLYFYMLQDLNRYTGYHAAIRKKKVNCLVLKSTSSRNQIATKGGAMISTFPQSPSILQNAPLSHMINMINGKTSIELPLIDETGYSGNVDLRISGISTAENLNKELQRYGLEIVREQRELDMMVISSP